MDSFFSSLRVKLMLLVLIVVLPLLGLIMYMGLNGEYLISRITGKPILTLLQPTLNKAGEVKNIIAAGIDLRHIHRVIEKSSFPAGAHVRIFDHNGTILYRYPDPGNYVGKKLPQDAVIKAALEKKEGLIEAIGLDGKPLLYGFTAFGRPGGAVYVSVGIPPEVAFAHVDKQFMYRLIWLILFTGVVLTLAWFWGEYYILRIMRHLLSTAQRVTSGDLHARVGSYYSHGEIGQLSEAFDKMLEELQKREGEARNAEARYRILFEQSPNGIVLVDTETGKTVEANETAYQQLGYTRDEFAELRISDYEVEENPE